jgi:DNA-binding transcriptional LysR family regulator
MMDRLQTMELFVRIVERGSFSAAAASLGVSRPVATAAIQGLEQRLGARLLHRTTRLVRATAEGEVFYQRCLGILAEVEDAESDLSGEVRGTVRIDATGRLARGVLLPALPELLARHPELVVFVGEGERFVDLVREGVDLVVRAGPLSDSDMIVRPLGLMEEVTCASPGYLAAHGVPRRPEDLARHTMIGFASSRTGGVLPLEFVVGGEVIELVIPARVLVNGAETLAAAARLGMGLIQAPRHGLAADLASGALVEVLEDFRPTPTPLSLLYPSRRQTPPRVKVVMEWLSGLLAAALAAD